MAVSQTQAAINAIRNIRPFEDYQSEPVILSSDEKTQAAWAVTEGIKSGEVSFSDKARAKHIDGHSDDKAPFSYVRGMIDNTLRKSKKCNGNIKYENKQPGSRTDDTMKNLLALQSTYEAGSEEFNTVGEAIEKRKQELQAEKAKKSGKVVEVNLEQLSPELREALGL